MDYQDQEELPPVGAIVMVEGCEDFGPFEVLEHVSAYGDTWTWAEGIAGGPTEFVGGTRGERWKRLSPESEAKLRLRREQ